MIEETLKKPETGRRDANKEMWGAGGHSLKACAPVLEVAALRGRSGGVASHVIFMLSNTLDRAEGLEC